VSQHLLLIPYFGGSSNTAFWSPLALQEYVTNNAFRKCVAPSVRADYDAILAVGAWIDHEKNLLPTTKIGPIIYVKTTDNIRSDTSAKPTITVTLGLLGLLYFIVQL
jgi:hypothetical protein